MTRAERFRSGMRLVALTDRRLCAPGHLLERVELALSKGATAIMLREKDLSAREMLEMARAIRQLTVEKDALLLVADRVDVALAADADAVHLGRAGLPVAAARRVVDDRLFITASAHSLEERDEAVRESADAILASPVFPPQTKSTLLTPLGVEGLREFAKCPVPIIALGGINESRVQPCLDAGAAGVAAIGMFFGSRDGTPEEE